MVKNPQKGHVRKILVQSASHRPVRKIVTAKLLEVIRYAWVTVERAVPFIATAPSKLMYGGGQEAYN